MSEWHNIGRISPVPAGTWSSAKAYKRLDIVTDSKGEKSYIALKDVPAGTALSDAAYWQLIVDNASATINAVNRLTSPFSKNGDIVICNPVEQHPLNAKSIVKPVQAGSGDPSPSNVRPISGFTGAKLTKCGKNLISRPYIDASKTENGITINVNDDGSISANGTPNAQTRFTLVDKFTLLPGTYTLSGIDKATTGHVDIQVLDPSYNTLAHVNNYGKAANTFTITEATAVKINIYFGAGNAAKWTWIHPQLELGTAATAYEPYHGETFSASFGQTVYGGTLDWNTGVLTVDRAILRLTGTENVQFNSGGAGRFVYYGLQNVIKPFSNGAIVAPIVCSHYKPSTADYLYNTPDAYAIAQKNGTEIWFSNTGFDSPSTFKAYLSTQNAAGTPVQLCYKLANPIEIQLTPQQILGLKGVNTLYSDCGKTDVSGRIDPEWMNEQLKNAIIALGGNV